MTKLDIKEMVKDGRKVRLEHYQSGSLFYVTETGFRFQVPVKDLGDARALPEEKAITFMKWIKVAILMAEVGDVFVEGMKAGLEAESDTRGVLKIKAL